MSPIDGGNNLIARNTAFLYVRMGVVMLITLYTSRVLLHALGVENYGVLNVVAGFVSMFSFLNASFVATIQRYYNYELGEKGIEGVYNVYTTSLFVQLILAMIVVALAETVGLWYVSNKLVIPPDRLNAALVLFHCSIASMFLVIVQAPYLSAILAFEKMNYYAIVGVIEVVLKLIIVILLRFFSSDKLTIYAILLFLVSVIIFLMNYVYAQKKLLKRKLNIIFHKDLFKSMISFTGWSVMGAFAQVMRNQGLNIILNLFFGPVVNAARGISFQIKGALNGFIANIATSVRPQLVSSYAAGNKSRSTTLMYSISKINFFMLLIMALPIALEIDVILRLWLGSVVPEYANIFSQLILLIALIDVLNGPISMILYASGKIGFYNIVTSIVGLLILPLSYFTLKMGYPPYSVYFLSLAISILVQASSILIMKQKIGLGVGLYMKLVLLPIVAVIASSVPIPFLLRMTIQDETLRIITVSLSSIVCVLLSSYLLGLTKSERFLCVQIARKITSKFHKIK